MPKQWIKNFAKIATSAKRKTALSLVNAALNALDTRRVVESSFSLRGDVLRIQKKRFNLARFENVYVIGFGKAAGEAGRAIAGILGPRLTEGVLITTELTRCPRLQTFQGTHPLPSASNVDASRKIVQLAELATGKDLVVVVVSGGGSALLCWPPSEREQGSRLYEDFLRTGGNIVELNTVRKHLSALKGGGLAAMLYPATVASLIFSDVPGDHDAFVASGPTFRDETTVKDARRILKKYRLAEYELTETPKEARLFERVHNMTLVSNRVALDAMMREARLRGLKAAILSRELYGSPDRLAKKFFAAARSADSPGVLLAGGEPDVKVPARHGRGGRNQFLTLQALKSIKRDQVFISFGSDGRDNGGAAGAIADSETIDKAAKMGLDPDSYLKGFDSQSFFERTGDLIVTGPTGANVSDLMLLLDMARK